MRNKRENTPDTAVSTIGCKHVLIIKKLAPPICNVNIFVLTSVHFCSRFFSTVCFF